MSSTLTPSAAFDFAKTYVKNTKLDDVKVRILDDVNKYMWMAAPWRWTIGSLPSFNLVANTQNYTVVSPGDVLYPYSAYVSDGQLVPRSLIIEPALPTTSKLVGQPNRISMIENDANVGLRVVPVPSSFSGGNTNTVICLYKKVSPLLTSGNIGTAGVLVFDDEWFWVYQEGVLWRSYLYADDERAGNITFADGKIQYTGQRASFEAGLQFMRENDKLHIPEKQKEA